MNNYLSLCLLLIIISCGSKTSTNNGNINDSSNKQISKIADTPIESSKVFKFENDSIKQIVELLKQTENSISFKLLTKNKLRNQSFQIEGEAKLKNGDVELDEDAEGNAYSVNEYIYNNKECWLAFRIDNKAKTKMTIKEADCNKKHTLFCSFSSVGVLKAK